MLLECLQSGVRLAGLWTRAVIRPAGARHLGVLLLAGPLLTLMWAWHTAGFLLDDLFFRGWRRVRIREPLFILGVPRSGTTSLHRAFAEVPHTTTFTSWELWFGLSVTARKLLRTLARGDRLVGRPLGRLADLVERRTLGGLAAVHPTGLRDPEEDYFALAPAGGCFILWMLFPHSETIWNTARMDTDLPQAERDRLIRWYRACWQKHLYVHGPDRHPLSKNAAFAGGLHTLAHAFPDARFLCCWRPAARTVPSLLNSVDDAISGFGLQRLRQPLRQRLTATMQHFYAHLYAPPPALAERIRVVPLRRQRDDLPRIIRATWTAFGRPLPEHFAEPLAALGDRARGHTSRHRYTAADLGIDADAVAAWPHAVHPPGETPETA